jgi:hypothetical protein
VVDGAIRRDGGAGAALGEELQFGIDVPGGADIGYHLPLRVLETLNMADQATINRLFPGSDTKIEDGFVVISADAWNCFCSLNVDRVISSVIKRCPLLVGFLSICYRPGNTAKVILDDGSLVDMTSLAQGCVASCKGCANVITDVMVSIRDDFKEAGVPSAVCCSGRRRPHPIYATLP